MSIINRSNHGEVSLSRPRRQLRALLAASTLAGLAAMLGSGQALATHQSLELSSPATTTAGGATASMSMLEERGVEADPAWHDIRVHRGDSLSRIFDRVGLTPRQLFAVLNAGEQTDTLKRLMPGELLQFDIREGELLALRYEMAPTAILCVSREGADYVSTVKQLPVERRLAHQSAIIEDSLYSAAKKAGLPDGVILALAEIFGWDIDFVHDVRSGDSFSVLYEQEYVEGQKVRDGAVLAAAFVNQGTTHRAVRFTAPDGRSNYFTPEGRPMRKAFLRSPVDFRRISSRFQTERYHPVLGVKRPHRGVDFAAPVGTPIKAAGDGRVVFRGWKNGYGNTVVIEHGGIYSTLYGHMSKFHSGVRAGGRVEQGQIIGYVGQTGLATGPHLHYEFRVNGEHRDPLTVKLPGAKPIPASLMAEFNQHAEELLASLDSRGTSHLAAME